jgi:116 kDa U5 small nuclear ribonucleoprotein component
MASFAEYDEFGNYIGPDIDSDDDEEMEPVQEEQQRQHQPLEGFDEDEEDEAADDRALMQIGLCSSGYDCL